MNDEFSNLQLKSSISNAELPTNKKNSKKLFGSDDQDIELSKWNPFEDPTPFNEYNDIYEAEFDALRDRPVGKKAINESKLIKYFY